MSTFHERMQNRRNESAQTTSFTQRMYNKRNGIDTKAEDSSASLSTKKGTSWGDNMSLLKKALTTKTEYDENGKVVLSDSDSEKNREYYDKIRTEKPKTLGDAAVKDLINFVEPDLEAVSNDKSLMATYSILSPLINNAGGKVSVINGGLGALYDLASGASKEEIAKNWNQNLQDVDKLNWANDVRGITANQIAEDTKAFDDTAFSKGLNTIYGGNIGNVPSWLYQNAMSWADSGVSALDAIATGGFSGGSGILGKGKELLSRIASLSALAGNASMEKSREMLAQGATEEEAAISSLSSGAIEAVTEMIGIDNFTELLLGNATNIKKYIAKALMSQMASEGLEEMISEVSNAVVDHYVMDFNNGGTTSQYKQIYDKYIEEGKSEDEAWKLTALALAQATGASGLGGALLGAFSGGGAVAGNYINSYESGKSINNVGKAEDLASYAESVGRKDLAQSIKDNSKNSNVGFVQNELVQDAINKVNDSKASNEERFNALSNLQKLQDNYMPKSGVTDSKGNELKIVGVDYESETLKTESGDVKFDDARMTEDFQVMLKLASDLDENQQKAFIQNYEGDINTYYNRFNMLYEYGKLSDSKAMEAYIDSTDMNKRSALNIYEAGVRDRFSKMTEANAQNEKIQSIYQKYGKVNSFKKLDDSVISYNGAVEGKIDYKSLDSNQKNNIYVGQALANALNTNVKLFNSKTDGDKYNGYYDTKTNTIYLDVYATNTGTYGMSESVKTENAILTTMSHELSHWGKAMSPNTFMELRDAILPTLAEEYSKQIGSQISVGQYVKYKHDTQYMALTEEEVEEELVARACENMLLNSDYAKKVLNQMSERESKTFVGKVKEILQKVIKAFKDILGKMSSKSEEYALLSKNIEALEKARSIYDRMLLEASEVTAAVDRAISEGVLVQGEKGEMLASIRDYKDKGREILHMWLDHEFIDNALYGLKETDPDYAKIKANAIKEAEEMKKELDVVYEAVKQYSDSGESEAFSKWATAEFKREENGQFSVIVNNGDYKLNIDYATVCKKREALNAVLNSLVKQNKLNLYTLTGEDIDSINKVIKNNGFEIACALCFVDSKRYRVGDWANTFVSEHKNSSKVLVPGWNDIVDMVAKENGKNVSEWNFTGREGFKTEKNNLISDMKNAKVESLQHIIDTFADGTEQKRMARLLMDHPEYRHHLSASEIIASEGLDSIKKNAPLLYNIVNAHWGSAKPKLAHSKIIYQNDVIRNENFNPKEAFAVGGVRIQSFSDFVPILVFDYVQMITELQAKKLPAHAYTKELSFAKIFGLTGIKINLSAIPRGRHVDEKWVTKKGNTKSRFIPDVEKLKKTSGIKVDEDGYPIDKDGNVITRDIFKKTFTKEELERMVYDTDDESIDLEEAIKLQNEVGYRNNVGVIFVGASDMQIWKMLDDDDIPMIIPYHKSSLNPIVARLRDIYTYNDYTDAQNTRDENGNKIDRKELSDEDKVIYDSLDWYKLLNENGGDPRKAANAYKDICEKRGWLPKFDKFAGHDNYYKLLEDFRMYYKEDGAEVLCPQEAVKMKLPSDYIETIKEATKQYEKDYQRLYNQGGLKDIEDALEPIFNKGASEKGRKNSAKDTEYLELAKNPDRNLFELDSMVKEEAKRNGYKFTMFHETDAKDIHIFDVNIGKNGGTDSETPYGIFTKSSNRNIGLGSRQMALYVKSDKRLTVRNREDVKNKIPALIPYYDKIAGIDKKYSALNEKLEWDELNAFDEWSDEHPDADMDKIYPTSYIIEGKPADIDSEKYLKAFEAHKNMMAEWTEKYNEVAIQCKNVITNYLRDNGYDSMYFIVDGGSRGRETDSLIVLDSNQVKSADPITYDDNGNIIPLSERFKADNPDIRYSEKDGWGNGYDGYSMSNNARYAYESGEKPLSRWSKGDILDAVREIDSNKADMLSKVNLKTLKDCILTKTSWHHTSEYYNKTDFYSINEDAVNNLTEKEIKSLATRKETKAVGEEYRGDIKYLEWSGTKNHPKAKEIELKDVNIEERGSFYIVTDDEGTELIRKKIGSNGTYVTNYEVERRMAQKKAEKDAKIKANSSEKAYSLYQEMVKNGYSESMSGNMYRPGRKPSRWDYDWGIENFFKVGEQILSPNQYGGYDISTWNGSGWDVDEFTPNIRYSYKDNGRVNSGTYFSGGGTVDYALRKILDHQFAVEWKPEISIVYRDNLGEHIFNGDVRGFDLEKHRGNIEYFHASPACQNFSRSKRNRKELPINFETAKATADAIRNLHPQVVTIENVVEYKDSNAIEEIRKALKDMGYKWDEHVYNSADYGAYTSRERLFIRAVADGELPPLPEKQTRKSGWLEAVQDIIPTLDEHKAPDWMVKRLENMGINYKNPKEPLFVFGDGEANYSVRYAYASQLIPTIKANDSPNYIFMPDGRVLKDSPRFLARITGLDDDYKLPKKSTTARTIIGNGIPVKLTQSVVGPLLKSQFPDLELKFSYKDSEGYVHLEADEEISFDEITKYLAKSAEDLSMREKYTAILNSLQEGFNDERIKEFRRLLETEQRLKKDFIVSDKAVNELAKNILKDYDSTMSQESLVECLKEAYERVATNEKTDSAAYKRLTRYIAHLVVEKSSRKTVDETAKAQIAEIRKELKTYKLKLSDKQKAEMRYIYGNDWVSKLLGKVTLSNTEGSTLDEMWSTFESEYPEFFDEISDAEEGVRLAELMDYLYSNKGYTQVWTRSETDKFEEFLSDTIADSIYEVTNATTLAEKYAKKYKADKKSLEYAKAQLKSQAAKDEAVKDYIADQREKFSRIREEYNERIIRNNLRDRIINKAEKLNVKLRKKDKKDHIPGILEEPLVNVLNALQLQNLGNEAVAKHFMNLANALENVQSSGESLERLELYFDTDGIFLNNVREIVDEMNKKMEELSNTLESEKSFKLNDLSTDSLRKVSEVLSAINTASYNYDRALSTDTKQRISVWGESTKRMRDQVGVKGVGKNKLLEWAKDILGWDNITQVYAFERFGEGGEQAFKAIQDGQDKLTRNEKKIIDYSKSVFNGDEAEAWKEETHDFNIKGGELTFTTAQLMSLYCLNKRKAAHQHMYTVKNTFGDIVEGKGIVSVAIDKKTNMSKIVKVTKADVEMMTSKLTSRQKEVADKLQKFMNTTCSDWGNFVTLKRFGILQFGEDNYFPMDIYRENSPSEASEVPEGAKIFKLLNMGFTNSLNEKADGALKINDIFDVYFKHASDMATYNALALPILDTYKWLSYKRDAGEGVKSWIREAYGSKATQWIFRYLVDLNGARETPTTTETLANKLIRNYKISAVAANMRVAMLQPTAYLKALALMDSKYLMKGLSANPKTIKASIEEMNEKAPLAMWKNVLGQYDINASRSIKSQVMQTSDTKTLKGAMEKTLEISMKGAELADEITWSALYRACQAEISETTNLKSKEFDDAVYERFRDICYRTQVFDSINARSELMRRTDTWHKILTSFASEPTLSYSMLSSEIFKYAMDARNGNKGDAWKKHSKKIMSMFMAWGICELAVSMVGALPDWLRDDDEDEEGFIKSYFKDVLKNYAGDTIMLPYLRDLVSVSINGYDPSRPDEELFVTMSRCVSSFKKALNNGEVSYKTVYNFLKFVSQLAGIPIANAVRDVKSLWNKTVGDIFNVKF